MSAGRGVIIEGSDVPRGPEPQSPSDLDPGQPCDNSPAARDAVWLRDVFRPSAPQLTWRAVAAGMVIGGVMALSNVYVVLKTGWSLGVTLTSSILAYGLFGLLRAVRLVRRPLGILENTMVGSVGSAAGFMTGGGNMAAVPALLLVTGVELGGLPLLLWFSVLAALGVFAAIPIKRLLINNEELPFPSAVATAATLLSMHRGGGSQGALPARRLLRAASVGAALAALRDTKIALWGRLAVPGKIPLTMTAFGHAGSAWSFGLDTSLLLVGSGTLMGTRTAWSLVLGSALGFGVAAPWFVGRGAVQTVSYATLVQATLWPGAAMLLGSGLVAMVASIRGMGPWLRALLRARVRAPRSGGAPAADDRMEEVECPRRWFFWGFGLLTPVAVVLMVQLFAIPLWAAVLAIPLSLIFGVVAARVTGETDITPTKALGPATQLLYGALLPGHVTANIMSANVTGGVGLHAADLLTDLKTGRILGASPRKQLVAQLFGVAAGAAVVVPAFRLLVPRADLLGTEAFPAPAVLVWAAVSQMLTRGIAALHPAMGQAAMGAFLAGLLLGVLERYLPEKARRFVPSPSGLGISFVLPASMSATMGLGALVAYVLRRRDPKADERIVPTASGLIAGESLMGVGIAILAALGLLPK